MKPSYKHLAPDGTGPLSNWEGVKKNINYAQSNDIQWLRHEMLAGSPDPENFFPPSGPVPA
jgi:hypothetical protein